jgi:hypothetical protein
LHFFFIVYFLGTKASENCLWNLWRHLLLMNFERTVRLGIHVVQLTPYAQGRYTARKKLILVLHLWPGEERDISACVRETGLGQIYFRRAVRSRNRTPYVENSPFVHLWPCISHWTVNRILRNSILFFEKIVDRATVLWKSVQWQS